MRRRLEYSIFDVFAERPLEGNPLAIVHDARGLSDERMQAIAREMNLSETTFVVPAENPEKDRREGVRVRIFTTKEELPFAGHPTLGTASWLHLHYAPLQGAAELTLRLNMGPIRVRLAPGGSEEAGVFATMWQSDAIFGLSYNPEEVAHVLGLEAHDLLEGAMPQSVSTGNPFCIVALEPEALTRLAIPQRKATAWLAANRIRWFYCIAPEAAEGVAAETQASHGQSFPPSNGEPVWRARMQFYSGEDPATGSAAGCAIAWLVKHGFAASGRDVVLRQGIEMGRPSRLVTQATRNGDAVSSVTVSGRTIPVAHGSFFLSV